jgi:hypothetical protein
MSLFVEFDEHTFRISKLNRHDRLTTATPCKVAALRTGRELWEEGRSGAHPGRYTGKGSEHC